MLAIRTANEPDAFLVVRVIGGIVGGGDVDCRIAIGQGKITAARTGWKISQSHTNGLKELTVETIDGGVNT